ncbi:MAG: tetratricopeptide repeat protein [Lentimicrobium sp.]|nr:tetratricopeptide repeat protein [Lentimicrobium sp.]
MTPRLFINGLSCQIFRIIFIPAITLAINTSLFAQNSAKAKKTEDNQNKKLEKAMALYNEGYAILDTMGYLEAEKNFTAAYALAKSLKEQRLMGKIANNLAECYSMTGRGEKAEAMYLESIKMFEALADTNAMSVMLINLGDEYAKTGRLELAAETELKAIRLKEAAKDYRRLAFYYQKLGELFIHRDNKRWEYYALKALELSRTDEYTTLYATAAIYNDLGSIYRIKKDFVKAAAYYDTMYRISEEAGYRKGISTATSEKALLLYDMGKYQEALPLAEKSYQIIKDTEDDYSIVYRTTLKARILLKLNRTSEAIPILEEAATRSKKAGLHTEEKDAYKYLVTAYRNAKQWEEALLAQDKYIAIKESTEGIEVQAELNNLQTQFETEKKQHLINSLNAQNLAHKKRNHLFIGLLAASILALVLLAFMIRWRNSTIRQNKILIEQQLRINKLEQEQLKIQLDYKARELSAATLQLINKNEVLSDLKGKLEVTRSSLPEVNQIIGQIDRNINLDNDWQNFRRHFEEVHPCFFKKLVERFPGLTINEERLCAYLLLKLNTKEISQMLNVTTAAVDKSRNRLRKKFDIAPEVNLQDFLSKI